MPEVNYTSPLDTCTLVCNPISHRTQPRQDWVVHSMLVRDRISCLIIIMMVRILAPVLILNLLAHLKYHENSWCLPRPFLLSRERKADQAPICIQTHRLVSPSHHHSTYRHCNAVIFLIDEQAPRYRRFVLLYELKHPTTTSWAPGARTSRLQRPFAFSLSYVPRDRTRRPAFKQAGRLEADAQKMAASTRHKLHARFRADLFFLYLFTSTLLYNIPRLGV